MISKERILKTITKLPNAVNALLIKLNRFPQLVYGERYIEFRDKITDRRIEKANVLTRLLEVSSHSLQQVAYYREGPPCEKLNSEEDFVGHFNLIDKDIVMNAPERFVADDIDRDQFVEGTTGGTSGKPMWMLQPKNRHVIELGAIHSHWNQFGFNNQTRAVLRSSRLDRGYVINPITREYIFDGFDLNDKTFDLMYKVMQKNKIKFLHCFPSSGFEFCRYMQSKSLGRGCIEAIFASSEMVYEYQIEAAEMLGLKYAMHYGHSEKLVLAHNCPFSTNYHIVQGYGYLELVNESGEVISEPGVLGEIVGSTLTNKGYPLIRYKTGDRSEYVEDTCSCGYQGLSLKAIYGRWDGGKIYNLDGSYVTPTALNLHSDLYTYIEGIQYVQLKMGVLEVRLVPAEHFTDNQYNEFSAYFSSVFKHDMNVEVKLVDEIARQENGKFLLLLSGVKAE